MFSFKKPAALHLNVLFHVETNQQGYHGTIHAENRTLKIVASPIRFAFENMRVPPALTPTILAYIFDKAAEKGYTVTELITYGNTIDNSVAEIREIQVQPPAAVAIMPQRANVHTLPAGVRDAKRHAVAGATLTVHSGQKE